MTLGGWISMTVTLGFVLGLFSWCCYKMATAPDAPDTPDDSDDESRDS